MKLRRPDIAGLADRTDRLAARDLLPLLHFDLIQMSVNGHPSIIMPDKDKIAKRFQLVTRIGNGTVTCRCYSRTTGGLYIDAIIAQSARLITESGKYLATHRPDEAGTIARCSGGWRC